MIVLVVVVITLLFDRVSSASHTSPNALDIYIYIDRYVYIYITYLRLIENIWAENRNHNLRPN